MWWCKDLQIFRTVHCVIRTRHLGSTSSQSHPGLRRRRLTTKHGTRESRTINHGKCRQALSKHVQPGLALEGKCQPRHSLGFLLSSHHCFSLPPTSRPLVLKSFSPLATCFSLCCILGFFPLPPPLSFAAGTLNVVLNSNCARSSHRWTGLPCLPAQRCRSTRNLPPTRSTNRPSIGQLEHIS